MLKAEVDRAKRAVNTDRVQITIGEVATMYSEEELNILPEFQRLHRWSQEKKSNFVESILIGIPVPPIFVFENEDGGWELVDGLQRISTILEFMGVLRDPDDPTVRRRSTLAATKYLPSLSSVVWRTEADEEVELDKSLQLFFRRARLDFEILKHPSDPKTKYDLFQRLNRGGAYANEQEVRTCSMVLADHSFTQELKDLSSSSDFEELFAVTPDQHKKQRDLEYLVRLIVHTFIEFDPSMDIEEYLSSGIITVIEKGDQEAAIDTARWVISTLYAIGSGSLLPPESPSEKIEGINRRFTLRALEVVAVGIAKNKEKILKKPNPNSFIESRIAEFWRQGIVRELSSAGTRGTTRIQKSVPFGEKWFDPSQNADD
ncbi:DUF262 domain-containing protein [Gordonia sp. GONU]|uniref:DUF262 domain-containing protein n=1 Tax=Gordonia sp. GONU TaxID=2972949 RepID=UPI0021AD257E|nr:DUF262 domain-containing protein [Gordonia sp. GONU]MCR8898271.1 DUF262 domain-containing protein [Gordonia sp. GONU]